MFIFLHPCKRIPIENIVRNLKPIPTSMKPGSVHIIEQAKLPGYDFYIGEKPFSKIKEWYLFSPGLSHDKDTYVTAQLGVVKGQWSFTQINFLIQEIEILHHDHKGAKLRIPNSVWKKLRSAPDKRKQKERRKLKNALTKKWQEIDLSCWKKPIDSKVVSRFASPRRLPSGRRYYHSGLDLRAPTGTPIRSANSGEVLLAEHMLAPGKTILISHGGGLFSRYMHLSEFKVKVGDTVKHNQVLGLAGATGRVEGAHLHWEVLWKGNHVNPLQFLQAWEQICDPT